MKAEKTLKKPTKTNILKSIIKGTLMAISISLIGICIFAFILRFFDISVGLIKPINQIIKILSVLFGVFYGLKKTTEMGLISGFAIGLLYTIIAFVIFSILNGGFSFDSTLINDVIFGAISGSISGIVVVNVKKK